MRLRDFLTENVEKHAVLAFGRMNPITNGHQKLVDTVKSIAKKVGGSHRIVLSHSTDPQKNPLTGAQKLKHAKRAFPGTTFALSTKENPNFLKQAELLHKQGVTHLHMVGGSDRVEEFRNLLHKYNGNHEGALYNFHTIEVHSAGERDPDAEGVTGISASKMRDFAQSGDYKNFKKGVPSTMKDDHAKEMYKDVRQGMKQDKTKKDPDKKLGTSDLFKSKLTNSIPKKIYKLNDEEKLHLNKGTHPDTHILTHHKSGKKRVTATFSNFSDEELKQHLKDNHDLS